MKKTTTTTEKRSKLNAEVKSINLLGIIAASEPKAPKAPKQINYLKEGITGKKLIQIKKESNQIALDELLSFSACIKAIQKTEFLKQFAAKKLELSPVYLLTFASEKEIEKRGGNNRFRPNYVMTLITRSQKPTKAK